MAPDPDSAERPPPALPGPGALAFSTLVTVVLLLAVVLGSNAVLNAALRTAGWDPQGAPALVVLPAFGAQRIAAVHLRRPPGRRRAALWALLTCAAVTAAVVTAAHTAAGLCVGYLVALPSAAAVYAWTLRPPGGR